MKSLEIVNEKIDYIEISKSNIKEVSPYYYEKVLLEQLNELQQIKQDLEILEIIKRNTSISSVEDAINWYKGSQEISGIDFSEKIKDYNRIKQWLEENENETKEVK